MRRTPLALTALAALAAGLALAAPAHAAARPGAGALRTYLATLSTLNRDYARVERRGKAAASDATPAINQALAGDRTELERVVAELRWAAAQSRAIARRASLVKAAPRTKHARYVAAVKLAGQAYTVSADGLEQLDGSTTARVNRLGTQARTAILTWRAAVIAAARRTRVPVPTWVKRAGR